MEQETIVAVATAPGTGGIAVIRLSGPEAFAIASKIWRGKNLAESEPYRARYGSIVNPENGEIVDDALATPFRGPASFTGEDTVEFAVHGSRWIQREVVRLLIDAGARMADHGEFTQRAFLNGKLDLAQAEGVADLIASSSRAGHRLAISQTRGGFSRRLEELREKLIEFASLLELELDFSEEDVEFADRTRLRELADETLATVNRLADSYSAGRALKEGVPVVIAGVPNAGKSTLLNALLGDDKAIVSDIPGTTRDVIEDTAEIDGILFRFIDTAGLRDTADKVERLGIERTHRHIANAAILIRLLDATQPLPPQLQTLPTS
ncbi:MAG: tRNA uridine-5-carboxymethylaminomethyl(34) synthesis GTPase MnmE, partial [Bacteroidales bacterium]|nr:tRNA uridine-5-carboxymethylaminomethyl(34) synthesis GTPase MnmE [Bacteroidales bacterium]